MNKMLKSLLVTALTVSAAHVSTYAARNVAKTLPLEKLVFGELVERKAEDKFGGNLQVVPFYMGSFCNKKAATLFGADKDGNYAIADANYLVHPDTKPTAAVPATVKLDPKTEAYGALITYHQDLEKIVKGLYFTVNVPVVHVKANMNLTGGDDKAKDVVSYFKGTYSKPADLKTPNAQTALNKAKLSDADAETGVADVEVKLGYDILQNDAYRAGFNLGIVFPTGNERKADHAFAPMCGNGKHWAIGAGLDGSARIWGEDDHNVKLALTADYRYLFQNHQDRTADITKTFDNKVVNAKYALLADAKAAATGSKTAYALTPAANLVTQRCDVKPGSQIEGLATIAYNNGGLNVALGYNLFWNQKEKVTTKDKLAENVYYIFSPAETTNADLPALASGHVAWVNQKDLVHAEKAAVTTHSAVASLGYSFKEWDTPVMLGLGGSLDFATSKGNQKNYTVFGKIGIAF